MPYRIGWYREGEVVYLDMIGDITADEYQAAIACLVDEYEVRQRVFYTMIDNRHLESLPPLPKLVSVQMPERSSWLIVIGVKNRFFKFISTTASQILNWELKMVDSLDDALTTLRRVAPELHDTELPPTLEHVEWFAASSPALLTASSSEETD